VARVVTSTHAAFTFSRDSIDPHLESREGENRTSCHSRTIRPRVPDIGTPQPRTDNEQSKDVANRLEDSAFGVAPQRDHMSSVSMRKSPLKQVVQGIESG
jgi:hypothetical protein